MADDRREYTYEFPMNSTAVTALMVIQDHPLLDPLSFIVCERNTDPQTTFPGKRCLPGSILKAGFETLEQTLQRAVLSETGIDGQKAGIVWHPFFNGSGVADDPRGHYINCCYVAQVPSAVINHHLRPGNGIASVFSISADQYNRDIVRLAFRHNEVVERGLLYWFQHLRGRQTWMPREVYHA